MIVLGIDPGATGAIAVFQNGIFMTVRDMPTVTDHGKARVDAAALARLIADLPGSPVIAFLERAGARPGQGVTSMFNYGMAYGIVLGVLGAAMIPVTLVTPLMWKNAYRVPRDKDGARSRASQLIPTAAAHWPRASDHGRAEAALIGLFGLETSEPGPPRIEW
jgi:crossover junction endodeoxyribonuclease RuvC